MCINRQSMHTYKHSGCEFMSKYSTTPDRKSHTYEGYVSSDASAKGFAQIQSHSLKIDNINRKRKFSLRYRILLEFYVSSQSYSFIERYCDNRMAPHSRQLNRAHTHHPWHFHISTHTYLHTYKCIHIVELYFSPGSIT